MNARLIVITLCFLGAMGLGARAMQPELVPLREPLRGLPLELDGWRGVDAQPFPDEILAVLGVDEYVNRLYQSGDRSRVGLYVGYYESQREGDTIHSPMNCLPGSGWQPTETGTVLIPVSGRPQPLEVNHVFIQKGLDRQVALYWYQSHGRVVANEYLSKVFMVYDAVRLNRSDAALVRVVSPVVANDTKAAVDRAVAFVQNLFPQLERFLPS